MPNIQSAAKRLRQSVKRQAINRMRKSRVKTSEDNLDYILAKKGDAAAVTEFVQKHFPVAVKTDSHGVVTLPEPCHLALGIIARFLFEMLRRLAERRTEEDLAFLEAIIAEADALLGQGRHDEAALADVLFRFHRGICLRSGNEFFPLLLNEFRPIIMAFWMRSITVFGGASNVHLAKRYLELIRAGDAEAAFRRLERSVKEYLNCLDEQ